MQSLTGGCGVMAEPRTREGMDIYPAGCIIRIVMKRSGTICADCIHAADRCKDVKKSSDIVRGYRRIVACEGFEKQEAPQ